MILRTAVIVHKCDYKQQRKDLRNILGIVSVKSGYFKFNRCIKNLINKFFPTWKKLKPVFEPLKTPSSTSIRLAREIPPICTFDGNMSYPYEMF